jgi:hypothetical protein
LLARLQEEVGRKEAVRALLDDHHRVPVVHVGRLEKPQRVPPERERLAVLIAAHARGHAEPARVELYRKRGPDQLGAWRLLQEAIHTAVLVPFPVQERDIRQPRRIEHFRNRPPDVLVQPIFPRMNQRRPLIVNQELVEGDAVRRRPGGDAVDAAGDVVDACLYVHARLPFESRVEKFT